MWQASRQRKIDGKGKAALPGLVNYHTRFSMAHGIQKDETMVSTAFVSSLSTESFFSLQTE